MPQIDPTLLVSDEIERMARAIASQLSPLVGERAVGTATVKSTGGEQTLYPNTYAIPILDGEAREDRLVKVGFNPTTVTEHLEHGEWVVDSVANPDGIQVSIVSAVGGERGNLPPGTRLLFTPAVEGIDVEAVVSGSGMAGGSGTAESPVRQVVFFDDLDGEKSQDLFQAGIGEFPAVVLGWMRRSPIEGRTLGVNTGRTRKSRESRAYFDEWVIYVVSSTSTAFETRRREGLRATELVVGALDMRKRNDDGERMSVLSNGVEVLDVRRVSRNSKSMIFQITLRTSTIVTTQDPRTFRPWLHTRYRLYFVANPENPTDNPETGPGVAPNPPTRPGGDLADAVDEMPT